MSNEATKKETTTALSQWTNMMTDLAVRDYNANGIEFDEYSRKCAANAVRGIVMYVSDSGKDPNAIDRNSMYNTVLTCASLKLNANSEPSEVYFQTRAKNVAGKGEAARWVTIVEPGIMIAGHLAMIRQFGVGVQEVRSAWVVKEDDEYIPMKMVGVESTPPTWIQSGKSQKVARVVVPIRVNGEWQYFTAERESVRTNLMAHIRNNMMNETFGICENRYKATPKQLAEIKAKKQEIYDVLNSCETVDDIIKCDAAKAYLSEAWLGSTESMIATKLTKNATSRIPKDYNQIAKKSYTQLDEVYKASQQEIEDNQNSQEFVDVVDDVEVMG